MSPIRMFIRGLTSLRRRSVAENTRFTELVQDIESSNMLKKTTQVMQILLRSWKFILRLVKE
ncbi:hypothetical protein DAPPUDRAFT_317814 [Daphnia pulex]|uniref:Uncharacterized protein n=1 Tax=Daphnia pulex TaxID=6669 RepID=E9GH22_DAPPU|nr:hypothetical protein DAPPUDRAFT_317814 [Daphnia pulex]|eukprot:EFX81129.1 hypothetical protein DAPPUDRAFT_317814 [Daphnia pulex]